MTINSGDLYCMMIFVMNRSASSGALIISLIGKYFTIFVYQSTTTRILSYTCQFTALSGSLMMKSIVMVAQGQLDCGNDDNCPYGLCLCAFDHWHMRHDLTYFFTSLAIPGQNHLCHNNCNIFFVPKCPARESS